MAPLCYRRHRFLPEIIQHAIWLYPRLPCAIETLRSCWSNESSTSPTSPINGTRLLAVERRGRPERPAADHRRLARRPVLDDPIQLIGPASSLRQQATAERPFARAGPMVRIRFPPADSPSLPEQLSRVRNPGFP